MTPENVATRRPFLKLNSLIEAFFCSSDISRSFDMPARPGNGDPRQADADAGQNPSPDWRARAPCVSELAVENRRHQRAERRAVAQGHGHPQRHAQVAHGQPERQSAQSPHRAPKVRPEQARGRRLAEHGHRSLVISEPSTHGAMIQLNTPPTSQYVSHDHRRTPR